MGLAQQYDQLNQLGMRIRHNLEQQIQARNQCGVAEDALKEFSMMFRHFDKDKTGKLDHNAFKSCLRALGYDLPMVEENEPEPEFEAIVDLVDPNRDGFVTLQEYMAFMISKETENVQSSEEIENAFRAITSQERDYVTQEELYSNLSKEMADYCVARMKPYVDPRTGQGITGKYVWKGNDEENYINNNCDVFRGPGLHGVHHNIIFLGEEPISMLVCCFYQTYIIMISYKNI